MRRQTIEDVILAGETRGMVALRPLLPRHFASDAARLILDNPGPVLIVTGFYILNAGAPETDGPPGAAALGCALRALGREVAYATDRFSMHVVAAVVGDAPIFDFPIASHEESRVFAAGLLASHRPSVLVAIERPGLCGDGTYRNWSGTNISECNAKADYLFTQHGISVGIGDGGNEIGMGLVGRAIGAGAGLPRVRSVTATTRLVVASCSNWGTYGVIAGLSVLTGRQLLPSVEEGHDWVMRAVEAGAVEGFTGERKDWVDGRPPEEDARCLRALRELVAQADQGPREQRRRRGSSRRPAAGGGCDDRSRD